MARNGSGTYSRVTGTPYIYNTTIDQIIVNNEMDDIATALSNSIAKDGQTVITGNIPLGGYKLTGLAAGTAAGNSVRYEQVADVAIVQIHAATGKTTPVDADELAIVDSAASNVLKKLTWANLKATLKTYFDTLYPPNERVSLYPTVAPAAAPDIFGAAGATINYSGDAVTMTSIAACTAEQVGSVKRIVTAAAASITASASLTIDGATSGTTSFPAGSKLDVLALTTSTFAIYRIYPNIRRKIISGTRAMNAASGSVSYTGVGFKANKISVMALIDGTAQESFGSYIASTSEYMGIRRSSTTSFYGLLGPAIVNVRSNTNPTTDGQYASVTSVNDDGVTLSWTRLGTTATDTIGLLMEFEG